MKSVDFHAQFPIISQTILAVTVHVFPYYTAIRWMSLGRIFKRICEMWVIVEKYFRSLPERKCPKFLHTIFNDEMTQSADEWKTLSHFLCFAFKELDALFGEVAELQQTLKHLLNSPIFPSNSFCESVFSVVKNIKTDERNRMGTPLLNALTKSKFLNGGKGTFLPQMKTMDGEGIVPNMWIKEVNNSVTKMTDQSGVGEGDLENRFNLAFVMLTDHKRLSARQESNLQPQQSVLSSDQLSYRHPFSGSVSGVHNPHLSHLERRRDWLGMPVPTGRHNNIRVISSFSSVCVRGLGEAEESTRERHVMLTDHKRLSARQESNLQPQQSVLSSDQLSYRHPFSGSVSGVHNPHLSHLERRRDWLGMPKHNDLLVGAKKSCVDEVDQLSVHLNELRPTPTED
ncbi:hypothetical protein GPALN_004509 [Globodera pallida]|nr:hypothetical protein GPALN_004509 [Globodera pallida]